MSWVLAQSETVKMTVGLAREFHRMKAVPNERPLSTNRLTKLKAKVQNHGALPFRWGRAEVIETGEVYRVNGQHSSQMLNTNPEMINDKMFVTVEDFLCDTMKDLADLYGQIDSSESSRTAGDINFSYAAVTDGLCNCNKRVINLAVTALSWEAWGEQYTRTPKEDRARLMDGDPDFVLFLDAVRRDLVQEDWRILKRTPVAHAMLSTWRKNKREAGKFWRLVGDGSGPNSKSADRVLNKYLMKTGVTTGRPKAAKGIARVEGPQTMYARCIVAWNAWRRGKTTSLRVYEDKGPPAAV